MATMSFHIWSYSLCLNSFVFVALFLRDVLQWTYCFTNRDLIWSLRAMNGQRATYSSGWHHVTSILSRSLLWFLPFSFLACFLCEICFFEFLPFWNPDNDENEMKWSPTLYVPYFYYLSFVILLEFFMLLVRGRIPTKVVQREITKPIPLQFNPHYFPAFGGALVLCFQSFPPWFLLYILCCFPFNMLRVVQVSPSELSWVGSVEEKALGLQVVTLSPDVPSLYLVWYHMLIDYDWLQSIYRFLCFWSIKKTKY